MIPPTLFYISDLLNKIGSYIFTREHIITIISIVLAIAAYELLKKSSKKLVGFIVQKSRSKVGIVIIILCILLLLLLVI